ncbi:reverse transcriptase domain-containing protein [Tanacetum coccineum]
MYHFQTTRLVVVLSCLVQCYYEVTLPDPYSAATILVVIQIGNQSKVIANQIMPPRKAPRTRTTPATTTNTTSVTNAQLQAMIDQGVTAALAARDANRSTNGEDSINFRNGCPEEMHRVASETSALTWWNSHVMTVGHDVAYAMTWTDMRKKMTDKYCPRNEIKKLEAELWNLKVKGTDEATEMATELMDKKISTLAERQAENKRKLDNNNQAPQEISTIDKNVQACTINGACDSKCWNCKKIGHMTRDCRNPAAVRNQRTLTCYEYGNPGHYRSDYPELKNQNHGNHA